MRQLSSGLIVGENADVGIILQAQAGRVIGDNGSIAVHYCGEWTVVSYVIRDTSGKSPRIT